MKSKQPKVNGVPRKSVEKLQTFFNESILYSDDYFPIGEIYELGNDGIYRQSNN